MAANKAKSKTKVTRALREEVCEANIELSKRGLAPFTFGNVSGIDRERGLLVIKPSGVPYSKLKPSMMVVTDLNGKTMEGELRASSDLPTHVVLYNAFKDIGGVVHTHSHYGTAWAQAAREIPCFGTTHADYFHGSIPVTDALTDDEINSEYEANTGHAIVRRFAGMNPMRVPAVLVAGHASFAWGTSVSTAVETMSVMEEVARLAFDTVVLNSAAVSISNVLHDRHFLRKHGPDAYYGQS
ncbi:MAG: L-ribulose-5-phosphate 4-epimerase AraD [Gemmatimonadota bacterium]|nr:L-ribulose-5-phosphate 4-epimerase AraD [Gemmatimonadota bacterium]